MLWPNFGGNTESYKSGKWRRYTSVGFADRSAHSRDRLTAHLSRPSTDVRSIGSYPTIDRHNGCDSFKGIGRSIGFYGAIDRRWFCLFPLSWKFLSIDRLLVPNRSAIALSFFLCFSFAPDCSVFLCFFISISVHVLKSPVHAQNSSKHNKTWENYNNSRWNIWYMSEYIAHSSARKP